MSRPCEFILEKINKIFIVFHFNRKAKDKDELILEADH